MPEFPHLGGPSGSAVLGVEPPKRLISWLCRRRVSVLVMGLCGLTGCQWSVLLSFQDLLVVVPSHPRKDKGIGLVLLELQESQA